MLEPFIDTMFICNMTAIVIVLTGVYADPTAADLDGAKLSAASFETVIGWFPYVIAIAGFLFAIFYHDFLELLRTTGLGISVWR